jgi:hypothetical protein
MGIETLFKASVLAFALVGELALIAGPFRERAGGQIDSCDRCEKAEEHSHWIRPFIHGWTRRPRPALKATDWLPNAGFLFLPSLFTLVLIATGVGELPADRLFGCLFVAAGFASASVLLLYVRRPQGGSGP